MARSKDEAQPLGTRIRTLRKQRGLGPDGLARAVTDHGVSWTAGGVGHTERGETYPRDELVLAIGDVLKPSLTELPEYYLARVRRRLDERAVGLDGALELYYEITTEDDRVSIAAELERAVERDARRAARPVPAWRAPRKATPGS